MDDLIITGSNKDEIVDVKEVLGAEFDMKDLGELKYFLGIEVVQMPQGIWMLQRHYVLDMLKKYGMMACKPVATPMEQNAKLKLMLERFWKTPQCAKKLLEVSSMQQSHGQTCCMM